MKRKIKIKNLDCANCALELEHLLAKVKGVNEVKVNFIKQYINIDYDEAYEKNIINTINSFEDVKVVEDKSVIKVCNIDCPNCALELEEILNNMDDVNGASVDFINQKVTINSNDIEVINRVKKTINSFEEVKVVEEKNEEHSYKKDIITIIIGAVFFLIGIIFENCFSGTIDYVGKVFYFLCFIIVGYEILILTVKNLLKGRIFDENFLMSIAAIGAMCIDHFEEGALVMLLYQIGELLQEKAIDSSRKEIASLIELKVDKANLIKDNDVVVIDPSLLKKDDVVLIKNGEKVPSDGIVIEGCSSFDTKSLTGEAILKDAKEGDNILGGYINKGDIIKVKITKDYQDSSIAKILNLIENSSENKAKPEKFITKFARYYTPIVCIIAFIIGIIVPLIISLIDNNYQENFVSYLYRAMTLLVISCPCALIISVPLTYFNGIGVSAKKGVLIKGATFLDELNKVNIIAFDKTGTLTKGVFEIKNTNLKEEKYLQIVASIEKLSNHPIARAFDKIKSNYNVKNMQEIPGKGLIAKVENHTYYIGNTLLFEKCKYQIDKINSVSSVIYVGDEKEYLGYIEIDDVIKDEAIDVIKNLHQLGKKEIVMLTGDSKERGEEVANILHLDKCYSKLLPEEKLEVSNKLKEQGYLLYVGDGINDAAVMLNANISVSMGKVGSDVAIESSDIVLIKDDLNDLVKAFKIARKTKNIVLENIIVSIALKVIFMILGILNILPLALAVFADVGIMLLAVLNSLRMRIGMKK